MGTIEIINNLTNKILAQQSVLDKAEKALNDNISLAKEYERQINFHNSNGNTQDANNVAVLLNSVYLKMDPLGSAIKQARGYLDSLNEQLDTVKANLTPEEEKVIVNTSEIKLANASANALKVKAETDKQNFVQSTTKYFIIGGIVLVVIVVGVFIYRMKKAPK